MPSLTDVEALLFDVFGTVVDWLGSVSRELQLKNKDSSIDWVQFTKRWRSGYVLKTREIAASGEGSTNIDTLHREILEEMLLEPHWSALKSVWSEKDKHELVMLWHRLNGWADATEGLYKLKKKYLICTLSNGNVRLLADVAKFSDLPWDVIFSGEMLGGYKPNPKVYLGAAYNLSIPPDKCVLVAAHIRDLRAAASHGYKTAYVRRDTEDETERDQVKSKADGGEVDMVVDSFVELAERLGRLGY